VTAWTRYTFQYGSGSSDVDITVEVPVHKCNLCEFEYLDEVGETIKHEAICEHLGVLPPSEILKLRENRNMSRAQFSELLGIDAQKLSRWENGTSMQSIENDKYLRLLQD